MECTVARPSISISIASELTRKHDVTVNQLLVHSLTLLLGDGWLDLSDHR